MTKNKKILLVANTAWYLANFRKDSIQYLSRAGISVQCASPSDGWEKDLPCAWIPWPLNRRQLNLFRELWAVVRLFRLLRNEKPDLVHFFTIKPVLYGTIAARAAGIPFVVNSVTGLGHVFLSQRLVIRVVRVIAALLYKLIARLRNVHFIFQNATDMQLYLDRGYSSLARSHLIEGSGIDIGRFPYRPNVVTNGKVLFVGRLLREKGVFDLLEAARILKARGSRARIVIAGSPDPGNPSSLTPDELEAAKAGGIADFLGHVSGVEKLYADAEVAVLPSYREGIPRSILEAFSSGVPVIACDVPGCRDLLDSGAGHLVPAGQPQILADAIDSLLEDRQAQERYRKLGRSLVEQRYSTEKINLQMLSVYEGLFSSQD